MFEDTAEAPLRCSSISLEDGADEASLNGETANLSDDSMRFPSRWCFEPGTILALTLELAETGERVQVEGVVVECECKGRRLWEITVLFMNAPAGLRTDFALGQDHARETL
jgi:hypothetical protein